MIAYVKYTHINTPSYIHTPTYSRRS